MNDLIKIAEYIKKHDGFAVVCHENPDGDALGSLMALTLALQKAGKKAIAACKDEVPYKYACIPGMEQVQGLEAIQQFDILVCVDCADFERIGIERDAVAGMYMINIDHHRSNEGYADLNHVDIKSASSGEIIYQLMVELDVPLHTEVATDLMVAVSTDTGHFSYANTTSQSFAIGAELVKAGVDVQNLCNGVYKRRTIGMTKLIGRAIDKMELLSGGKAALVWLDEKDYSECGAEKADSEGIIDYAWDVDTVELAVFVREEGPERVKVSMRSKDLPDVSEIAKSFGGGGHKNAAGFTLEIPMDEAIKKLKEMIEQAI